MRILAACKYVGEASVESYIATPLTQTMTVPPIQAAVRFTSVLPQLTFFPPNEARPPRTLTDMTN